MGSFPEIFGEEGESEAARLIIPDVVETTSLSIPAAPPQLNYGGRSGRAGYGYAHASDSRQRGLREYLYTILQSKWLILTCALCGLLYGYHLHTKQVLSYTASSLISIGSYVPPVDGPTADAIKFETSRGEYLDNLMPILTSYSLARSILEQNPEILAYFTGGPKAPPAEKDGSAAPQLDDGASETDQEAAPIQTAETHAEQEPPPIEILDSYLATIAVVREEGTSLLTLSATSVDKDIVATIANAHAAAFMEAVRKQRFVWATTNVDFLTNRLKEEEKSSVDAEAKMLAFARANQIEVSGSARALEQSAARVDGLMTGLTDVIAERITAEESVMGVRRAYTGDGLYFSTETATVMPSLKRLEAERDRLRASGVPVYAVESLEREIRNLRSFIKDSARVALKEAQGSARTAREKERALREQLDLQQRSQTSRSETAVQFSVLEKDYKARREAAEKTRTRLEEAMINAESDQKTVQLIDAALTPKYPTSGKKLSSLMSGSLLGLVVGLGIAFFLEYHKGAIRTPSDVTSVLEVPMLGVIPKFSIELQRHINRVKMLPELVPSEFESDLVRNPERFSRAFEVMLKQDDLHLADIQHTNGTVMSSLVVTLKPHTRESEAFRNLRAALKFCSRSQPPRRILVTSGQKGDGKTTVTVNLAASIAQTGARTLVIDADLRMPTVHEYFHYTRENRGLGDYLRSPGRLEDFIQATDLDYLSIMVAGAPVANPAELIGSRRMLDLIERVSEEYDYVFIDTPPVGEIADALLICQSVDGCLLVARSTATPRAALQLAMERLTQVRARVLGAALNGLSELDGRGEGYYGRYTYGAKKA